MRISRADGGSRPRADTQLVLSLQHLAAGIMAITGCGWIAIGIDCGLIVAELAAIVATLVLSAGLNAWAFAQHAAGYMAYASYAFGVFIPAAVFALGKIAVALTGRH